MIFRVSLDTVELWESTCDNRGSNKSGTEGRVDAWEGSYSNG